MSMSSPGKKYYSLIPIFILLVAIVFLFYFFSPKEIVDKVGITNSYFVTFLIAAIGGLSSFTGISFFAAIGAFSSGGANPYLLGLVGGVGLFISDTAFFFLARYGKKSIPPKWEKKIDKLIRWMPGLPMWLILTVLYIYIALTPLPNDIPLVALALVGFRYRSLAVTILIGDLTVATLAALIAKIGTVIF